LRRIGPRIDPLPPDLATVASYLSRHDVGGCIRRIVLTCCDPGDEARRWRLEPEPMERDTGCLGHGFNGSTLRRPVKDSIDHDSPTGRETL
jgi:hypothetical protein